MSLKTTSSVYNIRVGHVKQIRRFCDLLIEIEINSFYEGVIMLKDANVFIISRAVHILSVVLWIGGVSFVTTILLPAIRRLDDKRSRLELFERLEGRFSFQAKLTTLMALFSGLYMIDYLSAWDRYLTLHFWWMHLMTLVWFLFSMVLFVFEPLFLHEWFRIQAEKNSDRTFRLIQNLHNFLLAISLIAVVGATMGSHGW